MPNDKVLGAKANITYKGLPYVSNGLSAAWVLIYQSTNPGLAQTGWAVDPPAYSNQRYFFGWIKKDGIYHEYTSIDGPSQGSMHNYQVQVFDSSPTIANAYIDGNFFANGNIDWSPNGVQYSGETYYSNDQMPGKTTLKEQFSNIYYFNGNTYSWQHPLVSSSDWYISNSNYGLDNSQYYSNYYFYIWDNRY